MTNRPSHQQASRQDRGKDEEKANLTLVPDGPPKWTQIQRSTHKYEDIEIMDDQLMDGIPGSKWSLRRAQNGARSVGNLHMAWDESDIRSVDVRSSGAYSETRGWGWRLNDPALQLSFS